MIKQTLNKLFGLKLKLCDIEYRLKGYRKINSFNKDEYNTLSNKILQVYLYIETQNKSSAMYSLVYSLILLSSLAILL